MCVLLAYCTNIHPAESWQETFIALQTHALRLRDILQGESGLLHPFPIAPRLSARAATELLENDHLDRFALWVREEGCQVFTINGFPYGAFHGTRVKENVYKPDWSERSRLDYTMQLFQILLAFLKPGQQGSVSTLPGSFKEFHAPESLIFDHLIECATEIERMSELSGCDLHLGLEPEPLGHFENTEETLAFFDRLWGHSKDPEMLRRRIGVNYDTCHFALEYDDCITSLEAFRNAGIRISKVHLSAALAFDPGDPLAWRAIEKFNEPTYLHQVLLEESDKKITRFRDLPECFAANTPELTRASEARVHFHIPLDADPMPPLRSTRNHAAELLAYRNANPDFCQHYEIETYTWGVLPGALQRPMEEHLAAEYRWVLERVQS